MGGKRGKYDAVSSLGGSVSFSFHDEWVCTGGKRWLVGLGLDRGETGRDGMEFLGVTEGATFTPGACGERMRVDVCSPGGGDC